MKDRKAVLDIANVVGADPHKRTVTATVLDCRGGVLGTEAFDTTEEGLAAMVAWALGFGAVSRWGIEGASGPGRHTAAFLAARGHDVRDVCPNRTNERRRARQGPRATPPTRCASHGRHWPRPGCPPRSSGPTAMPALTS